MDGLPTSAQSKRYREVGLFFCSYGMGGCKYSTGEVLTREHEACFLSGAFDLGLKRTDQLEMWLKHALE